VTTPVIENFFLMVNALVNAGALYLLQKTVAELRKIAALQREIESEQRDPR
jgi:hypothetical protein